MDDHFLVFKGMLKFWEGKEAPPDTTQREGSVENRRYHAGDKIGILCAFWFICDGNSLKGSCEGHPRVPHPRVPGLSNNITDVSCRYVTGAQWIDCCSSS